MKYLFTSLVIFTMAFSNQALSVEVDDDQLALCKARTDRLQRLNCFDNLFNSDLAIPVVQPSAANAQLTPDAKNAFALLDATEMTDTGVPIALVLSGDNTGTLPTYQKGELFEFLEDLSVAEVKELRNYADLYIALPSLKDIGDEAVLVLSCQSNITNFEIFLIDPLATGYNNIEFIRSNISPALTDTNVKRVRTMSQGYKLRMPRGLEGINAINEVLRNQMLQISATTDDQSVSAFFETEKLDSAITLLSRHCSWLG